MAANVKLLLSTYACDPEEGSDATGAEAITLVSALGPHSIGNCWFSVGASGHGPYAEPKVRRALTATTSDGEPPLAERSDRLPKPQGGCGWWHCLVCHRQQLR
jgi:hypothetical protein